MAHDKFNTATEEALYRMDLILQESTLELQNCKWYDIKLKNQLRGVVAAFTVSVTLLHELVHKYDNRRGGLN